jgi:hypothetical protein
VLAALVHVRDEHVDRSGDHSLELVGVASYVAQHLAQRRERLADQREAELVERREVPVERGGHDPDLLGDLPQGDRRQALGVGQLEGSVEDRLSGLLLANRSGGGLGSLGHDLRVTE